MSADHNGPAPGTLVMITRNRAGRAADAVAAALALPDGWPVVVVDDASDDATGELLRERFGSAITVIELSRNVGAAARNVGAGAATTALVAFVDDDSSWEPGALTRAAEVMARHREVGLVAAHVAVEPDLRPDPVCELLADSPLSPSSAGPSVLGFLACAAVVRRRAFLDVGGFDPLLHLGGEEELLAIDLRSAGWTLTYRADVGVRHAPDATDGGRSERRTRLLRNAVLVACMRRPPGVAVAAVVTAARLAVTDRAARRALVEILQLLPAALTSRHRVAGPVEQELRLLSS